MNKHTTAPDVYWEKVEGSGVRKTKVRRCEIHTHTSWTGTCDTIPVVYYESIKRELNKKLILECRCDARLKSKAEGSTRLAYTEKFVWWTGSCDTNSVTLSQGLLF